MPSHKNTQKMRMRFFCCCCARRRWKEADVWRKKTREIDDYCCQMSTVYTAFISLYIYSLPWDECEKKNEKACSSGRWMDDEDENVVSDSFWLSFCVCVPLTRIMACRMGKNCLNMTTFKVTYWQSCRRRWIDGFGAVCWNFIVIIMRIIGFFPKPRWIFSDALSVAKCCGHLKDARFQLFKKITLNEIILFYSNPWQVHKN